jgi:hypothetical protein
MATGFSQKERTRELYEGRGLYPEPALPDLPDLNGASGWSDFGIDREGWWASLLTSFLSASAGLRRLSRSSPEALDRVLRTTDCRGNLAGPEVNATLALRDDPGCVDALDRAVSLVRAAYEFHGELLAGSLPPDRGHGGFMEMGQYFNLFGTSTLSSSGTKTIFKTPLVDRINVLFRGGIWQIIGLNPDSLKAALVEITGTNEDGPPIGSITGARTATQHRYFFGLKRSPVNVESLDTLRQGFLTLCLDLEDAPSTGADAARYAHSRNPHNRWNLSSFQIVVFGNAKACAICNFSAYLDGNAMMRGASEIQAKAMRLSSAPNSPEPAARVVRLQWDCDRGALEQASAHTFELRPAEPATFEFRRFGSRTLERHKLPPVPFFVLALHLAAAGFLGRTPRVGQFVSMSHRRCMGVTTTNVTTPEVSAWLDAFTQGLLTGSEAVTSLRAALESQQRKHREAARALSIPALFTFCTASQAPWRKKVSWAVLWGVQRLLRLNGRFEPAPPFDLVISHPKIVPGVTVVGRPGLRGSTRRAGFAMHYQIHESGTVVTIAPSWQVPNQAFFSALENALDTLTGLVDGTCANTVPPASQRALI